MKVLQIFRSEPDETVSQLSETTFKSDNVSRVELYKENVDWLQLVDAIFSNEKVVCWW